MCIRDRAVTKPAAKKLARVAKVKAKNNKAKTVKVTRCV